MARLVLTNPTSSSFRWQVVELSNPFNTSHYLEVILSTGTTSNGSSTRPSGVMSTISATSGRTSYDAPPLTISATGGTTYRLNAYARTLGGNYYASGSATITLPGQTVTPMPTSVYASGSSSSELYIYWSSVPTATQYRVRINGTIRTTSSTYMYWGGLSSNTLYTVEVQSHNPNNDIPYSGWRSTTGRTLAPTITPVPTLTLTVLSSTSIRTSWNSTGSSYNIRARRRGSSDSWIDVNTSSTSYTFTSLNSSTEYEVQIRAYSSSYDTYWSLWSGLRYASTPAPTQPDVPSGLTGEAISSSSIAFSWDRVTGAQYYELRIVSPISVTYNVYGTSYTATGLSSDTQYMFQIRTVDNSKDDPYSLWTGYRYARTLKGKPSDWGWDRSIVSGNSFDLKYSEWNRFTDKINEFRSYKGLTDYSFTSVSRGETFYASYFNQARIAINTMNPPTTIPPVVNSGEDATAYLFNRIMNSLNSIN